MLLLLASVSNAAPPTGTTELVISGSAKVTTARGCSKKRPCSCSFEIRRRGQRCVAFEEGLPELRDPADDSLDFDSHPGRSEVVDAGMSTTLCGIRLRCQLEHADFDRPLCDVPIFPDGGVGTECLP